MRPRFVPSYFSTLHVVLSFLWQAFICNEFTSCNRNNDKKRATKPFSVRRCSLLSRPSILNDLLTASDITPHYPRQKLYTTFLSIDPFRTLIVDTAAISGSAYNSLEMPTCPLQCYQRK